MFEGETPEGQAVKMLTARLLEALPIPVLDEWNRQLWKAARSQNLVADLQTCGDCQEGYIVQLSEMIWKEVVIGSMNERKIVISG